MLERLARAAGDPGSATYGPIMGDTALREAYAADLGALYGGRPEASQVAVTAGCNQAYFVVMMALAQRGDAVLLPTPWYFNHRMTLDMLGIEPRPLPCRAEQNFVPDPEEAEALLDEKVRAEQSDRRNLPGRSDCPLPCPLCGTRDLAGAGRNLSGLPAARPSATA
jgi:aspartate/methionine/tyrosine aminotransferase